MIIVYNKIIIFTLETTTTQQRKYNFGNVTLTIKRAGDDNVR